MESEKSKLLLYYQVYNPLLKFVEQSNLKVSHIAYIPIEKRIRQYIFSGMKPSKNVYIFLLATVNDKTFDIHYSSYYENRLPVLNIVQTRYKQNLNILSKIRY